MEWIVRTISELPATNPVTSAFSKMLSNGVSLDDIKKYPPAPTRHRAGIRRSVLFSALRTHAAKEEESIIEELYQYVFPMAFLKSLQFALFKLIYQGRLGHQQGTAIHSQCLYHRAITWINKFEWRTLTDYEKGYLKNEEWEDGLECHEDIKDWAKHYEAKEMVPAATNKQTADELVPLLLTTFRGL
ncbi:hypothetical protein ASPSYDRAFT_36525 [Aspergillus sydowii CBS 593.65]|uniref:Uncharacterized protein n=1 Tax=Aspergillus sydowii CBS 593.65 TaxID=1036612 RepID=A0A1L9T2A2_9EURO|nr:uncharacterized protein ASPSYDRAFT_36525 [Aspergillus sydowii CBS 593.65]OJJ53594.1 hypothetical protein ASPSYDRAFT_36525 [Aspergillus sydowii CBS 593.65]